MAEEPDHIAPKVCDEYGGKMAGNHPCVNCGWLYSEHEHTEKHEDMEDAVALAMASVGVDASADGAGFTELCVLVEEVPGKEPREHELHIEANSFELTVDVWNGLTKATIALDPDQVRVLLVALNAWLIGR